MGRKRTKNKDLPRGILLSHGAYYFKKNNKWTFLARDYKDALIAYANIIANPDHLAVMKDLFARFQRDCLKELSDRTKKDIASSIEKLNLIFGEQRPRDVRSTDIYRYTDYRSKSSKTWANKDKSVLNQVFNQAIRWGIIEQNPCRDVKGFIMKPRDRLITPTEFDAVCGIAVPLIQNAMYFAFYTKCRLGELLNVKLDDLKQDFIRLHSTKTGKDLHVEWSPKLSELVSKIKQGKAIGSFYLFSTKRGRQYTADGFKSIWQRTMNKAMEQGILTERFTFHDIRAMAITHTHDKHGLQAASEGAGHSSTAITKRVYVRSINKVKPTE